jgi:hypothetical protein
MHVQIVREIHVIIMLVYTLVQYRRIATVQIQCRIAYHACLCIWI